MLKALEKLNELTPVEAAWAVFALALVTILGAWGFERAGYLPCDLCLKQRWAYYAIIPLALLLALAKPVWIKAGLWVLTAAALANTVFGAYHMGVEYKWWPGPETCGAGTLTDGLPDLSKPVVKCDEPALYILGLSLAGWNANVSAMLAYFAAIGALDLRRYGSSSASQ
jgi:disulfide bond formation protein DsbB